MILTLIWLQLATASAIILGASYFLTRSADIIAFKTGLGRSFVGVLLLATVTSLPELGTGIGSVALIDEPDLAVGTVFGSNVFNLLIIGLLDLLWRDGPILTRVGKTPILIAGVGILIISLGVAANLIHSLTNTLSAWYISPFSVLLLVSFLAAMYVIFRSERSKERNKCQTANHEYATTRLPRASLIFVTSATVMLGSALWLANTGDRIAEEMKWETSYVGTQFLAFGTSLPELATSIAAIRLGAPELAIANLLGSNLFNMGLILFLDDLAFTDGTIWAPLSRIHALMGAIAILMTVTVIIALMGRRRKRLTRFVTGESMLLIGLYVAASLTAFYLS
jgi:cation:H+ antiporter